MAKVIDLNAGRVARRLSPLASIVLELVRACEDLVEHRPDDPELNRIAELLEGFIRETTRDEQGKR